MDNRLRLLVIDDDEDDFIILRDALAPDASGSDGVPGFDLDWVPNLSRAREQLLKGGYDAYLIDYLLGPDSGLDLVAWARGRHLPYPLIVLTGQGNPDVDRAALEAGADDYLVKGYVDPEALARTIRYAVRQHAHQQALEESEQRYRWLFEQNPLPAYVFAVDDLRILAVNEAALATYGYSRAQMLAMNKLDLCERVEADRVRAFLADPGSRDGHAGIWTHVRRDGSQLQVEVWTHALAYEGRDARLVMAQDVTERLATEARLLLLDRAIQSSMNGVMIADARQAGMPITYLNPSVCRITGYSEAELIGRDFRSLQGEAEDEAEVARLHEAIEARRDCSLVMRNPRKDGSLFWNDLYIAPVRDAAGEVTHYVGIQNDITERRRVEEELAYATSHDATTGLERYTALEGCLAAMLDAAASTGDPLWLFFIDIDRFHGINESMGDQAGDHVLRTMARRLQAAADGRARLARFAGDEFVAIVPALPEDDALALAESMREVLAAPVEWEGYRFFLSASIGVSGFPLHGDSAGELLRRAEAAMGQAKREGRDTVRRYSAALMQAMEDRLVMGGQLRSAITANELLLHYQPQVRASDGRITGFEALVRWNSPSLGLVPPGRFIPVAEALGLMPELGQWVLDAACAQIAAWRESGHADLQVAVNVAAQQLLRPDFLSRVQGSLRRHGVPPDCLQIELTESSLMENVEVVRSTLDGLKGMGVSLALDDFGTGYSSLAYLKRFELDKLKIDRSFVDDLPRDSNDGAIARTIIAMGHQMRMSVAAEGVETAEQCGFLRTLGCDELQGFLFSRPVPAAELELMQGLL